MSLALVGLRAGGWASTGGGGVGPWDARGARLAQRGPERLWSLEQTAEPGQSGACLCAPCPGGRPVIRAEGTTLEDGEEQGLRQTTVSQGNTIETYTTPSPLPHQTRVGGPGDELGTPAAVEEPLRAELLAAIQGLREALERKLDSVAVEVNLPRADLWKISDKVKVAEGSIVELQTEVGDP
ncbi:hypothetical protein NDU88_006288 [Pleurodeles waltl]|uniref:Uncharacterized protein n=1 Tax=Pleurodeles waltl TaxID=8319 RepID=A0AAV7SP38_PLEWA|nr:hypothetical protein NDU88_006288 [Pleurodeles waltl]